MSEVNQTSNDSQIEKLYSGNNIKTSYKKDDIDLEEISVLYTTEKTEDERTDFSESFDETLLEEAGDGKEFLEGLISNKSELSADLGLDDEQYDSLACIALAIASQETGMGFEDGYESENTGIGKFFRSIAKQIDVWSGGSSASSGLTQIKIYDFLNSDKLTDEQKQLMEKYGIEADGVSENNLYDDPDKAAVATMIVLSSIADNYDDYKSVLQTEHDNLEAALVSDSMSADEALEEGNEILDKICDVYENASDSQKSEIRTVFKQWLLAQNGSKEGDEGVDTEYNEEVQLNKLNELLAENSADFQLDENSLDLIRYALTADGEEMTVTEYCAYGWNKGTGETGMQLDRMLAEKVGTILSDPDDFDYDQFTTNVAALADKYAAQSQSSISDDTFDDLFE